MAAENKVVTLETLGVAVNKIKADYPTKEAVTQQIDNASLGSGVTYATEAEVLALFNDTTAQDGTTE